MSEHVTLLPIEAADVTILVDNSVDLLLPGNQMVQRAPFVWDWSEREQLIAEQGYSLVMNRLCAGRSEAAWLPPGADTVSKEAVLLWAKRCAATSCSSEPLPGRGSWTCPS